MGFVRQLNEGVSRIYQSMEKSMLSIPEYAEKNGNVYLILRNKISNPTKTIPDFILKKIMDNWKSYNETQKNILHYLFYNNQSTIEDLVVATGINEKTVRIYLNQFKDDDNIIDRLSSKMRDKDAKYTFRKI